jgi:hypothetical protein
VFPSFKPIHFPLIQVSAKYVTSAALTTNILTYVKHQNKILKCYAPKNTIEQQQNASKAKKYRPAKPGSQQLTKSKPNQ